MICVIDYGMGNLRSVSKALEKLGASVKVSSAPEDLERADKIVLPGVGAFGNGCEELKKRNVFAPLRHQLTQNKPFLGICLGMQLLFKESEESPAVEGLGVFSGKVRRFGRPELKIPHMGWNQIRIRQAGSEILRQIKDLSFFYFVHSYYPVPEESSLILATCDYGGEEFACLIGRGHVWGTQFHPEKSQDAGLQILRNFVAL